MQQMKAGTAALIRTRPTDADDLSVEGSQMQHFPPMYTFDTLEGRLVELLPARPPNRWLGGVLRIVSQR